MELNKDEVRSKKDEVKNSRVAFLAHELVCTNELISLRAVIHWRAFGVYSS